MSYLETSIEISAVQTQKGGDTMQEKVSAGGSLKCGLRKDAFDYDGS